MGAARHAGGFSWRRLAAAPAVLLITAFVLAACGKLDSEQVRLCRTLITALEPPGSAIELLDAERDPVAAHAIKLRYRSEGAEHWVSCRFAGGGLAAERLTLSAVATDREGLLSEAELYLLRRFWLGFFEAQGVAAGEPAAPRGLGFALLYLAQQAVNAITVSSVYGLLAIGYTLIFGMVARINLAFGEMAMLGAFATLIGVLLLALSGVTVLPLALIGVLLMAMAVSAVASWTSERLLFRPLRHARSQAALIATVGLAIFLQEFVRLTQGADEHWLQRPFAEPLLLAAHAGFSVSVTTAQVLVVVLTGGLYVLLHTIQKRSGFGRAQRACADDPAMAALCGVQVDRTIGLTFALSGAYAGAAGLILALYYGGVHFFMGSLIGFKALVAAVIGGIGSLPGAMLGGLLVGLLETFWSGYLSIESKDIAVFALLAAFLVFRPQGLFGRSRDRGP